MADMLLGGYVFLKTSRCRDCDARVYWFRTPRARQGPFVKTPKGRFTSHFAVCPALRVRYAEASSTGQGELFPIDAIAPLSSST
jgi:hypothetical protein